MKISWWTHPILSLHQWFRAQICGERSSTKGATTIESLLVYNVLVFRRATPGLTSSQNTAQLNTNHTAQYFTIIAMNHNSMTTHGRMTQQNNWAKRVFYIHGIQPMYIWQRFSWDVASVIRRCTYPCQEREMMASKMRTERRRLWGARGGGNLFSCGHTIIMIISSIEGRTCCSHCIKQSQRNELRLHVPHCHTIL